MNLEDRLRRALRRVEPDDDFAARVLGRLDRAPAAPPRRSVASAHRTPRWALAASVVLALGIAALLGRHTWLQHADRLEAAQLQARNEAVSRQLAYALDLTSRELESMHRHLERKTEETGS